MFLLLTKDNGKKEDWVSNNEAALRATREDPQAVKVMVHP